LLAAAITGGNFSFEFDWSGHPGAQTPWTGELLILIDPDRGASRPFAERCEHLITRMVEAGQERQPGDRRYRQRARAEREGIP
ncbi:Ldh family oxidoreductase, partial [Klebsiella pneumoniae]|nr:Ldh family oxidoreductase [Klebsiella pneumoniae]